MRDAATGVRKFLAVFFRPESRAWRGEATLSLAIWVYGVSLSFLLTALSVWTFMVADWALLQVLVIADFAYTAWVLVVIWRCSARATVFWGGLARWLTIAWGLNAILVLSFVEIELAIRYAPD